MGSTSGYLYCVVAHSHRGALLRRRVRFAAAHRKALDSETVSSSPKTLPPRVSVGPGWSTRADAALNYAIAVDPVARGEWQSMEAGLLRTAWHPAVASAFLHRAITDAKTLMAEAWPTVPDDDDPRPWRVPKSWITKGTAAISRRLIDLGVLRVGDFLPFKERLIAEASPRKARHWIMARVLAASDFIQRRQMWIAESKLQFAADLIKAGICTFEDFPSGKQGLLAGATPVEAAAAIKTGVCTAQDFADKKAEWIASATPKHARRMIAAGICTSEDFAHRKQRIITTQKTSTAWCWIVAGVCTAQDFAHRKASWIETATVKEAQRLISAGICLPEDFAQRKQAWVTEATATTIKRLIASGVCTAEDFPPDLQARDSFNATPPQENQDVLQGPRTIGSSAEETLWPKLITPFIHFAQGKQSDLSKQQAMLSSVSPLKNWIPGRSDDLQLECAAGAVDRLRSTKGAATREEHPALEQAFEHDGPHWRELRRLAILYLRSQGVELLEDHPTTPSQPVIYKSPFLKEHLADEETRLGLSRQLSGISIEAEVTFWGETFCFLAHPDFPENIFCGKTRPPRDEKLLAVGDRVRCQVLVRMHKKRGTWGFVVAGLKRLH